MWNTRSKTTLSLRQSFWTTLWLNERNAASLPIHSYILEQRTKVNNHKSEQIIILLGNTTHMTQWFYQTDLTSWQQQNKFIQHRDRSIILNRTNYRVPRNLKSRNIEYIMVMLDLCHLKWSTRTPPDQTQTNWIINKFYNTKLSKGTNTKLEWH